MRVCGLEFYDDGDDFQIEPRLMFKTLLGLKGPLNSRTKAVVGDRLSDLRLQTARAISLNIYNTTWEAVLPLDHPHIVAT